MGVRPAHGSEFECYLNRVLSQVRQYCVVRAKAITPLLHVRGITDYSLVNSLKIR